MKKSFIALVAVSTVLAAHVTPAFASTESTHRTVEVASEHLRYRSFVDGENRLHFVGTEIETGRRFHLTVLPNGRVVGNVDGASVRYRVSRELRDRAIRTVAAVSRTAPAAADAAPPFGTALASR